MYLKWNSTLFNILLNTIEWFVYIFVMYICNLHNVYSFNFALVCFMLGIMFSEFSVVLIQFYRYIIRCLFSGGTSHLCNIDRQQFNNMLKVRNIDL